MERRSNRTQIGLAATVMAAALMILGVGCESGPTGGMGDIQPTNGNPSVEDVLDMAQKTTEELQGKESGVDFVRQVGLNEEVNVTYRMRDYTNAPKDYETIAELERALTSYEGKAAFRIKETGTTDSYEADEVAGQGNTFFYAIFEFKGDATNKKNNKTQPSAFGQTGWDWSPQPVIIVDGKAKDMSTWDSGHMSRARGFKDAPELEQTDWTTYIAVWKVKQGSRPTLAILYQDMSGAKKYVKVNY